jgi:2-amino-4-hydroxy-6-hydroxymethyldihydropteridine diphosphokinase
VNVVIGLGANLGDRLGQIRVACEHIAKLGTIHARSRVFETEFVGPAEMAKQPLFLNAAIALETELSPAELMTALLDIERAMGRVRAGVEKNSPRTIDLDLLWVEGKTLKAELVTVPHPRLKDRAFALAPLLDVAPAAREPATRMAYAEIAFDASGIRATDDVL